jgi:hypothetical protein
MNKRSFLKSLPALFAGLAVAPQLVASTQKTAEPYHYIKIHNKHNGEEGYLSIYTNGNIGVGTDSPNYKLHVTNHKFSNE